MPKLRVDKIKGFTVYVVIDKVTIRCMVANRLTAVFVCQPNADLCLLLIFSLYLKAWE